MYGITALQAQTNNPYHINGNASQENCNCYTLTRDQTDQSGSVWNINKIDLTQSFDYHFNVFLGCNDNNGADGIAFVLQPISTSIGNTGQGLGIQGVSPSVIIAIDTYQNSDFGDPSYDNITMHINGDLNHNSTNNIAGPVSALDSINNIEDCQWHIMRISWNAPAQTLTILMDGKQRLHISIDLVHTVFHDDPMVFWGFTGATGSLSNHQRFCTSLNALFSLPVSQVTCYPTPVNFIDSSTSFGSIDKWYWNFGDGTTDTVQNPPAHVYPQPGNYNATLNILGNNGCISDTFSMHIVAGSKPVAGFDFPPPPYCDNKLIAFDDLSTVAFGTINQWNWTVNGTDFERTDQEFSQQLEPGNYDITLQVKTREGCTSGTENKTIYIQQHPEISITDAADACKNEPVIFKSTSSNPVVPANEWFWNFGDGSTGTSSSVTHAYTNGGEYTATVYAAAQNGCSSDTITQQVTIFATNAFAGRDTVVAIGQPLQLQGSGGDYYQWNPSAGLDNASIANPVAILQGNATYTLTVSSDAGCPTTDTISIKAYKGPEFYIPTAFTPNGDGRNDVFHFTAPGIETISYFRIFNRYGQLVYSSTDPAQGWDGMMNGKPQATDTYVWMIEGKDYLGKIMRKKGVVTLIR